MTAACGGASLFWHRGQSGDLALPPPREPSPDANYALDDAGERLAAEGSPALAATLLQQAEPGYMQSSNFEFASRRDEAGRVLAGALKDYETHCQISSQPVVASRERWARFLLEHGELAPAQAAFEQVLADAADPHWAHVALARAGLARARYHTGQGWCQ